MIFKKRTSSEATWTLVRAELKRLRGQNLLRAREEAIPAKNQLILFDEHRGEGLENSFWAINIDPELAQVHAVHYPGGEILHIQGEDLRQFMETLAGRIRQKDYVRTRKKGTTYR